MTLHLTHDMMVATYDYLRQTRPFKRWGMPPSEFIEFGFTREPETTGKYTKLTGGGHRIRMSDKKIGSTVVLLETMAHEMCHLKQVMLGAKYPTHGADFRRLAALVCKHHGFDPKQF